MTFVPHLDSHAVDIYWRKGWSWPWAHHEGIQMRIRCAAPLFLTSELDGGKLSSSHPGRFTAWKERRYQVTMGLNECQEPIWTFRRKEKSPSTCRLHSSNTPVMEMQLLETFFYRYDRDGYDNLWMTMCKQSKVTPLQARLWPRGGRGIALLFQDLGARRGWVVNVTPRPHFTPGKTRYPLYRRMGGLQSRSGQVQKTRPYRDSIPGPPSP